MTVSPLVAAGGQRSNNPHYTVNSTVKTTCACTTFPETVAVAVVFGVVFGVVGEWDFSLHLASGSEVMRLVP